MRGLICVVVVVVPLVAGLLRSRQWLARQWSGPLGAFWCIAVGVLVGSVPGLLAGARLGLFAVIALPLLATAAVMLVRRPGAPVAAEPVRAASREGAESAPQPAATPVGGAASSDPAPAGASLVVGPRAAPPRPAGGAGRAGPAKAGGGTRPAAAEDATQATQRSVRPSPAVAALRAMQTGTEGGKGTARSEGGSGDSPTTVTECILSMSISCEEYMLRNLHEMARAPLPESQRDTLTRLIEETDDKLARLRAAQRRHQGEELVRATWNQLPEVDLPVVKPGASLDQIREKAVRQTQVMIDFYRTVASYAQRPSLKGLLVNLALDGQRHLSVIEHTG